MVLDETETWTPQDKGPTKEPTVVDQQEPTVGIDDIGNVAQPGRLDDAIELKKFQIPWDKWKRTEMALLDRLERQENQSVFDADGPNNGNRKLAAILVKEALIFLKSSNNSLSDSAINVVARKAADMYPVSLVFRG